MPMIGPGNSLSTAALASRMAPSGTTCKISLALGSFPEFNNFQLLPSHGEVSSVWPRQSGLFAGEGFSAWHLISPGVHQENSQTLSGSRTETKLPRIVNSARGSRDGFTFAAFNNMISFTPSFRFTRNATISKFL